MPAPDETAVLTYLGKAADSKQIGDVRSALAAELAAQARVCMMPLLPTDPWPADLSEALCRRVARNLALRKLPLGHKELIGDGVAVAARVELDAEIERLEGPFRTTVTFA